MKQPIKTVAIVVAVVGMLAVASYATTGIIWDGAFLSGEFRLNVVTPEGTPVKGAVLRVYTGGTRERTFGYPLDNYTVESRLVSDDTGAITAIHESRGIEFGGHAWWLFWIVPMGEKAPRYDCEISADGYKPLTFPIGRLFEFHDQTFVLEH